jgi:hypothetical protein
MSKLVFYAESCYTSQIKKYNHATLAHLMSMHIPFRMPCIFVVQRNMDLHLVGCFFSEKLNSRKKLFSNHTD